MLPLDHKSWQSFKKFVSPTGTWEHASNAFIQWAYDSNMNDKKEDEKLILAVQVDNSNAKGFLENNNLKKDLEDINTKYGCQGR